MSDTNPYLLHADHLLEAASHPDPQVWNMVMKIAAAQNTILDQNREARMAQIRLLLEKAIQAAPETQQAEWNELRQKLEKTWQDISTADDALAEAHQQAARNREAIENILAEDAALMQEMNEARNALKNQVYRSEAEAATLIQSATQEATQIYRRAQKP